jgi:hypothetical protein
METFIDELLDSFTLPNIETVSCENMLNCTEISENLQFFAELELTDEIY